MTDEILPLSQAGESSAQGARNPAAGSSRPEHDPHAAGGTGGQDRLTEKEGEQPGPQAVAPNTENQHARSESTRSGYFITKTQIGWCLVISVVVALAIGLGVGLGVGLTRDRNTSQQAVAPSATSTTATSSSSSVPQQTTEASASTIYNDTSIAAFESSDRHRHIFYQAINGSIQYAVYDSKKWTFQDLGISEPRDNTPLSALTSQDGTIYLFYIMKNSTLTSIRQTSGGTWRPCPIGVPLEISNSTRQLTASLIPSYGGDASDFQLFLLTQRPNAGVSLLHLAINSTQSSFTENDITDELNKSNSTRNWSFNSPCAAATNVSNAFTFFAPFLSDSIDYPWIGVFSNQFAGSKYNVAGSGFDGKQLTSSSFSLGFNNLVPDDSATLPATVPENTYDLEIAVINNQLSILYVSNNELISSGEMNLNPGSVKNDGSPYPFTRLGTFLSAGGLFYLYHQLDGSTMVEAVYDPTGSWKASNITIGG